MCCCCLPRKCVFCLRLRTGCLVIAGTELAVHGVLMCYVATRIHIYANMMQTDAAAVEDDEGSGGEGGGGEDQGEDSSYKLTK